MNHPPASLDDYPWTVDFDGLEVTFRPMTADDKAAVLAFARALPEEDLLFLRTDITRESVVDVWIRDIEDEHTVTVLAEAEGRLIGHCSLHHSESLWTRHLGEIQLLVHADVRGRGLGGHLARQILELAKGFGHLQKLVVQMMSTLRNAQSLFHHLGFIPEAMLHDWVIDRNGRTHNLIMMSREVDPEEDFFAVQPPYDIVDTAADAGDAAGLSGGAPEEGRALRATSSRRAGFAHLSIFRHTKRPAAMTRRGRRRRPRLFPRIDGTSRGSL